MCFKTPIKAYSIPLNLKEWFTEDVTQNKRKKIKNILKEMEKQQDHESLKLNLENDNKMKKESEYQKGPKKQKLTIEDDNEDHPMTEYELPMEKFETKAQPITSMRKSDKIISDLKNL